MSPASSSKVAAGLGALAVAVVLSVDRLGDYIPEPGEDNPAPTIGLLAEGRLSDAADVLPAMGLVSILLRVPAALIGGDDLALEYRLGSVLCFLAVVALGTALLARRFKLAERRQLGTFVLAGLLVAGPAAVWSVQVGHPEEVLGGALCAGAVLAATDRRVVLTGVLLGLAMGTKQWAAVAVVPALLPFVLADAPRRFDWLRVVGLAAAIAALFTLPAVAANPERYRDVARSLSSSTRVEPQSFWWPVSKQTTRDISVGSGEVESLTTWRLPLGLNRAAVTAPVLMIAAAAGLLALRRRRLPEPMALLAALLALRAILDPFNHDYYLAPALIALTSWELRRPASDGLPVISLAAAAATWVAWRPALDAAPWVAFSIWAAATIPLLLLVAVRRHVDDHE